jgi:ABC-type sugar transport system ATPase subunit
MAATNPTVLLLNDVTRGVDIGTKTQIYAIIYGARRFRHGHRPLLDRRP